MGQLMGQTIGQLIGKTDGQGWSRFEVRVGSRCDLTQRSVLLREPTIIKRVRDSELNTR